MSYQEGRLNEASTIPIVISRGAVTDAIKYILQDGTEVEFSSPLDALLFVARNGNLRMFQHIFDQIYHTTSGANLLWSKLHSSNSRFSVRNARRLYL